MFFYLKYQTEVFVILLVHRKIIDKNELLKYSILVVKEMAHIVYGHGQNKFPLKIMKLCFTKTKSWSDLKHES